ncbi:MAG: aspartate kinase [Planctomycetota bacterium]|nr:aspartate kinase [Planctomycetota bacterium]
MIVCKFGGTSLASAAQIRKVCDIVLSDPKRRLIVVSAPGKRDKSDTKVTDLLIACAEAYLKTGSAAKEVEAVITRYADIARELGVSDDLARAIAEDIRGRLATSTTDRGHFLDTMKAAGEDNAAKLVAAYLQTRGVEAHYVSPKDAGLLVSHEFGNAQVLPESYRNLAHLRDAPGVTVFPGFFGYSPAGAVVTFPRGGSDITGSILAAAVKAEVYENFTDVDCVFVTNPQLVPNPRPITELSYREMRELSYAGFSIFHEEALSPVFHAGVPVCIKNTNNPSAPGTRIVLDRVCPLGSVTGIACGDGFCTVYLSKYLMNREVGFGRRLLQILEEEGLSYEHAPSGIDNISVILREREFTPAKEAAVVERIRKELQADDVSVERGLALVMIVGECMRNVVGLAARATKAFATAGVSIEMINQGSSEVSMMFGVKAADMVNAVRALYREFFGA